MEWFKQHSGERNDARLRTLTPAERWVWFALKCLASEQAIRGEIPAEMPLDLLALEVADGDVELLDRVLDKLLALRLLVQTYNLATGEHEGWQFPDWHRRQDLPPSETREGWRERQRRHRANASSNASDYRQNDRDTGDNNNGRSDNTMGQPDNDYSRNVTRPDVTMSRSGHDRDKRDGRDVTNVTTEEKRRDQIRRERERESHDRDIRDIRDIGPDTPTSGHGHGRDIRDIVTDNITRAHLTEISETFPVTEAMALWAREHLPGMTPADVDGATQQFHAYYRSKGEPRANWQAAWQNWMLRERKQYQQRGGYSPNGTGSPSAPAGAAARKPGVPVITADDEQAAERLRAALRGPLPGDPPAAAPAPGGSDL